MKNDKEKTQECLARIDRDLLTSKIFSFHHYAVKFNLDAHELQSAWAIHNHAKKALL